MSNPNVMPKSLHTVTVLMQFARAMGKTSGNRDAHAHVAAAVRIMFDGNPPPDSYGLAITAARKLAKEYQRGAL